MTEHKMRVIDGIRYRPEDAEQAARRAPRRSGPLSTRTAQTRPAPKPSSTEPGQFDPSADGVDAVLAYLGTADYDEAARVLDAEADGKARSTILGKREEILAAKEGAGDGDSGGASR
jgi:hypothetical protein